MSINQLALSQFSAYYNKEIYGGLQQCVSSAETLTSELQKFISTNSVHQSSWQEEVPATLCMSSLTSVPTVELLRLKSIVPESFKQTQPQVLGNTDYYDEVHLYDAIA
ncbi:MAG: hypothetical protein NC489_37080 [Ruminococcus flavefaciens]|nr:hypothetical protein [Ruminococcus flavefaciens]